VQLAPLDNDIRKHLHYRGQGVAIVGVISGASADKAGLQPGDVVQQIDGKAIANPDQAIEIVVWSGGKEKSATYRRRRLAPRASAGRR
jgi:S1-C subfamily serine protease